jgi:hypothetical protein
MATLNVGSSGLSPRHSKPWKQVMPSPSLADGVSQKSISQGMPPGDRAQRATFNNMPLADGQLQNSLLAASQSGAPAQGMPAQSAPPGQQMTAAIAQHIGSMPPQKLAQAQSRADYLVHAFGTLARMPNLTFKDVIAMAGQSVADGKATPQEASAEVANLPQNPTQLRAVIAQRFKAEIISASLLSGSQQPAQPQGAPPMSSAPAMAPAGPAPGPQIMPSNMLIGGSQ